MGLAANSSSHSAQSGEHCGEPSGAGHVGDMELIQCSGLNSCNVPVESWAYQPSSILFNILHRLDYFFSLNLTHQATFEKDWTTKPSDTVSNVNTMLHQPQQPYNIK